MTTEDPTSPPLSDKDYLELLLYKLGVMKNHGSAYYARKMESDKRLFEAAKADVNEFMRLLRKRGYDGSRYGKVTFKQGELL